MRVGAVPPAGDLFEMPHFDNFALVDFARYQHFVPAPVRGTEKRDGLRRRQGLVRPIVMPDGHDFAMVKAKINGAQGSFSAPSQLAQPLMRGVKVGRDGHGVDVPVAASELATGLDAVFEKGFYRFFARQMHKGCHIFCIAQAARFGKTKVRGRFVLPDTLLYLLAHLAAQQADKKRCAD